jgi:hypothetical protein
MSAAPMIATAKTIVRQSFALIAFSSARPFSLLSSRLVAAEA